ncbi:MAG: DUF362 domain-containing protein [Candidatus Electrothrix sp. AW3_4]|nr:DUF362 domain-containing protein [Candidatus Electrothrix gigas]
MPVIMPVIMSKSSCAVALLACSSYEQPKLSQSLDKVLGLSPISSISPLSLCSAQVLLKPNLISAKTGPLACTEGAFILAVAKRFIDQGAKVSLGDSPAFGTTTSVLNNLNLLKELAHLGVQIRSFTQGVSVNLPNGNRATLARAALECDLLVNMPRVKAHAQARLTMAVKNYFGCLIGLRKAWWHMAYGGGKKMSHEKKDFFDRLVQFPAALPPAISLVDGITAMHISGPLDGRPYPLSVLGAATNAVAVDRAFHAILGVAPQNSPLMAACQRAKLAGAKFSQLSFPLSCPADLEVNDFQVPGELNPVRFNLFRFFKSSIRRFFLSINRPI